MYAPPHLRENVEARAYSRPISRRVHARAAWPVSAYPAKRLGILTARARGALHGSGG